jgi:xanthine dehydrogenase YagS FAD-binding subunit
VTAGPATTPATPDSTATVELRAGGTDLGERRRSGIARAAVVDIAPSPELTRIDRAPDGSTSIGALVPVAGVAEHPGLAAGYPGLAAAAAGLATPQIRRVGTLGGNLLQHNRCWYYRNPHADCLRRGGTGCPARAGNHRLHVLFDLGPCVAPHPSTLGAALLAYAATVRTDRRSLPVAELFGDGTDGSREHRLAAGELLTAVVLPAPAAGERAAYVRATSRAHAEWPLVESVARLVLDGDRVAAAAVVVGAVAPVPLRLAAVEDVLTGRPATPETFRVAAARAADGATPLPQTGYKRALLTGTVYEALCRAARTPPASREPS